MRILYLDIDTLRADHLGCYGYHRNTSPNIDRVAAEGVRFDACYVSDAPCLPSRAAMFTGQFGIHNGAVGHGGTCADVRIVGRDRNFNTRAQQPGFIDCLRHQGLYPVSISPYAERHSAWWFYAGWREMVNTGKCGGESAEEVMPYALDWIRRNAERDDWVLHVNIWDPHTPYRAPEDFGDPFRDDPVDPWYTEELRRRQWNGFGPGSPQEPAGNFTPAPDAYARFPRMPAQIASLADYKKWIDGYDCGVAYADMWCGRVLDALADKGVLDDTLVLVTSDHGETLGELGVTGDHQTADHVTSRVPMIVRHPHLPGRRVDPALLNQVDLAATLVELAGGQVPSHWDGRSFADAFRAGQSRGRDFVVFCQNAWSCQRSVRWGDHVLIRSYHTGLKNYPARMLFHVGDDPHETCDLAESHPELADRGSALIDQWTADMMTSSQHAIDPMWQVMREGGPYHTRNRVDAYCQRLRNTGRAQHADFLQAHPTGLA